MTLDKHLPGVMKDPTWSKAGVMKDPTWSKEWIRWVISCSYALKQY